MTTRRLFLAKLAGLAGFTLLSKAKGDYTKPLSLPVVLPRTGGFNGGSRKPVVEFPAIDYDRLLYCISAVETNHDDAAVGPCGARSRYQISEAVWRQHNGGIRAFSHCAGRAAKSTAHDHLRWLGPQLSLACVWSLAWSWRGGIGAWENFHGLSERKHKIYGGYADRVAFLYSDPDYHHT